MAKLICCGLRYSSFRSTCYRPAPFNVVQSVTPGALDAPTIRTNNASHTHIATSATDGSTTAIDAVKHRTCTTGCLKVVSYTSKHPSSALSASCPAQITHPASKQGAHACLQHRGSPTLPAFSAAQPLFFLQPQSSRLSALMFLTAGYHLDKMSLRAALLLSLCFAACLSPALFAMLHRRP